MIPLLGFFCGKFQISAAQFYNKYVLRSMAQRWHAAAKVWVYATWASYYSGRLLIQLQGPQQARTQEDQGPSQGRKNIGT